jgi:TonB family protein
MRKGGDQNSIRFYQHPERGGERSVAWLFRGILLATVAAFLALGIYFSTVEPPPQRSVDTITRVRSRFLIEEKKKPAPVKPVTNNQPKKEEKPAPEEKAPDKPIDLTQNPTLNRKQDDIPDEKPEARRVRRVYGLRKVYSKGLGSGGDLSDAVIGKRGNTLNKQVDTLSATDEEVEGRIVSTTTVSTPPRYKKRVKPAYTEEMLENEVEGTVKVKVLVDIDGKVKKATLLNDLGHGAGRQALKACLQFTFHPAMRDDQPVAVWIIVPIRFVLLG